MQALLKGASAVAYVVSEPIDPAGEERIVIRAISARQRPRR